MFSKVQRQVYAFGNACQKLTGLQQNVRGVITQTAKSQTVFDKEAKYGAHNYHPLPVAINRGEGNVYVFVLSEASYFTCILNLMELLLKVIVHRI